MILIVLNLVNLFLFFLGHNELLTDKHVLFLSKLIATDNTFHKLGIKLGIPENEIAIIKTDNPGDVSNQAYYTLDKWRKLKGESAFILVILNELHELERNDIIKKFCSVDRWPTIGTTCTIVKRSAAYAESLIVQKKMHMRTDMPLQRNIWFHDDQEPKIGNASGVQFCIKAKLI